MHNDGIAIVQVIKSSHNVQRPAAKWKSEHSDGRPPSSSAESGREIVIYTGQPLNPSYKNRNL